MLLASFIHSVLYWLYADYNFIFVNKTFDYLPGQFEAYWLVFRLAKDIPTVLPLLCFLFRCAQLDLFNLTLVAVSLLPVLVTCSAISGSLTRSRISLLLLIQHPLYQHPLY